MKKEYIMSEEDKELKRRKVEQNRNKRKLKTTETDNSKSADDVIQIKKAIKEEEWSPAASSVISPASVESETTSFSNNDSNDGISTERYRNVNAESSVADIVGAITEVAKEASYVIQKIMHNKKETVNVMSRIVQEPKHALLLISHLIKYPADGMIIISKLIESPMSALSVFTQFMSSPSDALQIIMKTMTSPEAVLQFITELSKSTDPMEVVAQFMVSPSETLKMINKLMNGSCHDLAAPEDNLMIKSMLDVCSVDSSSSASPTSSTTTTTIPPIFQSSSSSNTYSDTNNNNSNNNNDYQEISTKLLNEISHDLNGQFQGSSIDSIINEAIKLEYDSEQVADEQTCYRRELNDVEIMKIQELIDSNKALYAPVDNDLSTLVIGDCQIKVCVEAEGK